VIFPEQVYINCKLIINSSAYTRDSLVFPPIAMFAFDMFSFSLSYERPGLCHILYVDPGIVVFTHPLSDRLPHIDTW
jgi:hypothetical protein